MAHHHITVTQLKCAVLDVAWREKWLAGKNPSTMSYAPSGSLCAFGIRFHQETELFVKWLTSREQIGRAAIITSVDDLMDAVWSISLQNFTDELITQGKPEEAAVFTERIRNFCQRLVDLRARTKKFENWQDVFIASEQSLQSIRLPVGKNHVEVGAKVDAIRFHPKYHLEVVDYKLSQGAQQNADLIQLAIYARLLPIWREGCSFCGTLEYYLPEFMEVHVSPRDLSDLYSSLVEPVLREMFDSPPASSPFVAVVQNTPPAQTDLAGKMVEAFRAFKLEVETSEVIQGPQVVRIKLKPSPGVKVSSLANRAEDLQIALSLHEPPLIKAGKGFVIVDLPRSDRQPVLLRSQLDSIFRPVLTNPVSFPIGIGVEGDPVSADFSDPNTCHALVAGTSGSGKSEWLKALVASITLRNKPEQVRFGLVDPKILTFCGVTGSPYLWKPVATNLDAALEILRSAVKEMDARYRELAKQGVVSLGDRFAAGLSDIPFLVLIFDEFADLILAGRDEKKEFEEMVARIAGKGRAAGIHLVLATQRPDRTVVTGLIKSNLPLKVCLRVTNSTNSQIVLDEPGAESLFGKGDLLTDFGKGIVRAQGMFIPQADFLAAVGKS
jgi:S-DNA-T family DNA segregation ATPase FtsK/SpoIIIE